MWTSRPVRSRVPSRPLKRKAEETWEPSPKRGRDLQERLQAALDEEMDAFVQPVLDKAAKSREPPAFSALQELVSQVQGLADVRRFVDEQLAVDLGARVRGCNAMAKNRSAKAVPAPKAKAKAAARSRAPPTAKLAMAPFRSGSRVR
ncbi:unnamed protein product [Effrenium voratum]|nr:unnamed protein product [Effrenium voratum]